MDSPIRRVGLGLGLAIALAVTASMLVGGSQDSPQAMMRRADDNLLSGRIEEAVAGFDALVSMRPDYGPQLWQRGIALYYAGRFGDCRMQFESHRLVNPNDVENAVWHFLCVARAESPAAARAVLLPVGPDRRVPMREVYQMFEGAMSPAQVMAAAGSVPGAVFFANLYVGLYYDAMGDTGKSREHIAAASSRQYASVGGYMHQVARLHYRLREGQ